MLLSVIITTYNQAAYVEQAIMSTIKQQTNFDYEIIIADDASVDHTVEIINKICKKYEKIVFIKNEINLGISSNYAQCLRLAKGKYIADIAGDDIWTDNFKLQKEVDYLEKNPNCGMVHTQYDVKIEESGRIVKNVIKDPVFGENVFEELLIHNSICSITVCYRKELVISLIDKFESGLFAYEDTPMWLEISSKSHVGYLNDSTALYRVLNESASHTNSYEQKIIYMQNVKRITDYFLNNYPVNDLTRVRLKQNEYIQHCCIEFISGHKKEFISFYKKLDYKPKRIRLMNILSKSKVLFEMFHHFKINICRKY